VRDLEASKRDRSESYKILFLGRHGQGIHNVAEAKYGTQAWNCYYSALDGFDGLTWTDAHLTSLGRTQAQEVHHLWSTQIPLGIPLPETYYVSPLTRALETADLTFANLDFPHGKKTYTPYIKELLREALGIHTCDRRSSASHIHTTFPSAVFEPGFSEADELWQKDYREPASARDYRLAMFLDDVFATDKGVFLSMTSHSGAIGSLLRVMGHRVWVLPLFLVLPCC
jgi:broad specificity phosphatase PhoE